MGILLNWATLRDSDGAMVEEISGARGEMEESNGLSRRIFLVLQKKSLQNINVPVPGLTLLHNVTIIGDPLKRIIVLVDTRHG